MLAQAITPLQMLLALAQSMLKEGRGRKEIQERNFLQEQGDITDINRVCGQTIRKYQQVQSILGIIPAWGKRQTWRDESLILY